MLTFNPLMRERVFLFFVCISQASGEFEDPLKSINHLYFVMNDLFISFAFLKKLNYLFF